MDDAPGLTEDSSVAITKDSSASKSCNYGDATYWNDRYKEDDHPFDWYQNYVGVSPLIRRFIPLASSVLMAGCGNAVISEDMVKDGYNNIVNIDISPIVIEAMQKKYFNVPQLKYITMNVLDLSFFDDCTFEAVVDKGTLDSIMCGMGAASNAAIMLAEISRVLKPNGVYMLITYGDPQLRIPHLRRSEYGWSSNLFIIPQSSSTKAIEPGSKAYTKPVLVHDDGTFVDKSSFDEAESSHYVYVCQKEA